MDTSTKNKENTNTLGTLLKLISLIPVKKKFGLFLLVFISLLASILEVFALYTFSFFMESIAGDVVENDFVKYLQDIFEVQDAFLISTLLLVLIFISSGLFRVFTAFYQARFAHSLGNYFSVLVLEKTLEKPYLEMKKIDSGEVVGSITMKSFSLVKEVFNPFNAFLTTAMLSFSIILGTIAITPYYSISIFLILFITYSLYSLVTKGILEKTAKNINIKQNQLTINTQETLGSFRDIKQYNIKDYFINIFKATDQSLRRSMGNVQIIGSIPKALIESIGIAAIAIISYFIVKTSDVGLGDFISQIGVIALAAQRLLPNFNLAYKSLIQIIASTAISRSVIDSVTTVHSPIISSALPRFKEKISIKNLSHSYGKLNVLKNTEFEITKGERICLLGKSGSGKSSLLDILSGIIDPISGQIYVDGQKFKSLGSGKWRKSVAYMSQSSFLINDTILSNIAIGVDKKNVDKKKAIKAIKFANLTDEHGKTFSLDLTVGENGSKLSGGQKQRVALARCYYRDADIILFDEATSALDETTEKLILENILSFDRSKTIIFATHNKNLSKMFDKTFLVKGGEIHLVKRDDLSDSK